MKHLAKRITNRLARSLLHELRLEHGTTLRADEAVAQKSLMQQYRLLAAQDKSLLPAIDDAGFRIYSQFEEDGILLYLFALIRTTNRKCVEICAGNGQECMTANLIINHGWWGCLFDGLSENVRSGIRFFANNKDTSLHPPKFTKAWITAENVNEHLAAADATGTIDLLSLDLDGMDYWVWKAIEVIKPRVVVCETNNVIPVTRALTVPYDANFVCDSEEYRGASLEAMCHLGKQKGYRLIGTHRFGFNAFFVKEGLGEEFFPEVPASSCLNDSFSAKRRGDWKPASERPWIDVRLDAGHGD